MYLALLSIPLAIAALGLYCFASYSEGKQMHNGARLYSNQEPKIR
jgi:hypothetical protein